MRAAWYETNGPADEVLRVGEQRLPEPQASQVRIRLSASGINPSDVKKRAGMREAMTAAIIPHSDGAGVVEAVGSGTPESWLGQRVRVFKGQFGRNDGTAAEYICLPVKQVVALEESMSFVEGACLGIPAMTAHRAVFVDGPVDGQTVLVTGGAGGVGHYAIQLARWGGARVITTVSGPAKAEHARAAGADVVLNYREDDLIADIQAQTGGQGVNRIIEVDFGGNLATSSGVLATNGTIATYASMGGAEPTLPFYQMMFENVTVRTILVYNMPDTAKSQAGHDINRAHKEGALRHAVDSTFELEDIVAAHERVECGKAMGNVILTIAD